AMLFLTIFVMLAGAFSYWFRGWSITIFIVLVIVVNLLVRFEVITKKYYAFGLDYDSEPIEYSLATIEAHNTEEHVKEDILQTIKILDNWKNKFQSGEKPKIVFVSASGGGQRAALWTINALQKIDSATQGNFMESTILITGASGGLIGASYYRDLLLLHKENKELNLKNPQYLDNIAKDNLNPIIFNLLVNDFFMGFQKFEYQGKFYTKDRGYAFEQQLNKNTEGVMDRAISAYRIPEIENKIPMMILAPTIMNDGRKLYISPQHISYMNSSFMSEQIIKTEEVKGIEFLSYFKDHGAEDLRMLSALRMSATFPYITPNITLPSNPRMEIMDAGVTDNFGISDGVKFLHTFREWIEDNTSGVIFVSIRDSQKNQPVEPEKRESMFQKMFSPLNGLYSNFERIQDINNDTKLEMAQTWFKKPIYRITMEYNSANNQVIKDRASLNWRLTTREKKSIISNIYSSKNQIEIEKIVKHLQKNKLKGAEELNPETRIEE
ncbi:MAG: patatin-like phospholipase family protein, partial [Cyclobacteriaceae bacterium]|nr:patatin-like phospholipase family protein [Cyclobacteriaceae bacterium]